MKIDTHNHSTYSPDGQQSPRRLVCEAIKKGIEVLCVTEHLDNFYPDYEGMSFPFMVTNEYFDEFKKLREKFADKLEIIIGIEVGWTKENEQKSNLDLCMPDKPYEYIINSVHIVDGDDVYRPEYYKTHKNKQGSYEAYLDAVYKSLFAAYDYDTIGHLGYVARYANYKDNRLLYEDFSDKLDKILNEIISRGKILEVNSSTGKSGSITMPDLSVLERYYSLGGRNITFGSDSHYPSRLGLNYDIISNELKKIGFDEWTLSKCKTLRKVMI